MPKWLILVIVCCVGMALYRFVVRMLGGRKAFPGVVVMVAVLVAFCAAIMVALFPGPLTVAGRVIDVHTMILGGLLAILGVQVLSTGLFARVYSYERHFDRADPVLVGLARHFNLERGLLLGLLVCVIGFALDLNVALEWIASGFGPLDAMRRAIVGSTLLAIGAQITFSSFFLSMLTVRVAELRGEAAEPSRDREAS